MRCGNNSRTLGAKQLDQGIGNTFGFDRSGRAIKSRRRAIKRSHQHEAQYQGIANTIV